MPASRPRVEPTSPTSTASASTEPATCAQLAPIARLAPARDDWTTADRVDLPGFRPVEAYETALANIAPELARRPDPEDVGDVLTWAGMPLATAEIAAVCDRPITDVREELARIARFEPVGGDGYWAPA